MYSIFHRDNDSSSAEFDRADYEMLDWRYREVLALIASGHIVDRIEYGGETLLNSAQIKNTRFTVKSRPQPARQDHVDVARGGRDGSLRGNAEHSENGAPTASLHSQ